MQEKSDTPSVKGKNYADFSRDELIAEINRLKKTKKYGLVWEHKKEEVIENFKAGQQPYLKEAEDKRIENAPGEPTNLIIEGDNFDALSVLNYTHAGKIDVIYIDPPYNTGNKDFIYNDNYVDSEDAFRHSKWLSFMEPRLKLAKNLLKDDGVIFISIDDNELSALKLLCDNVFGGDNYVGNFIIENNPKGRKNSRFISVTNEYCVVYAKKIDVAEFRKTIPKEASDMAEDENGDYIRKSGKRVLMGKNSLNKYVSDFDSKKHYTAYIREGSLIIKKEASLDDKDKSLLRDGYRRYVTYFNGRFVENTYTEQKFTELFESGALDIRKDKIYEKHFSDNKQIKSLLTNIAYDAVCNNKKIRYEMDLKTTSAKRALYEMMGRETFTFPKNVIFIKHLIDLNSDRDAVILDFFAGSGTTGQAVLELNKEDDGHRQFILCTNNGDKGPDSTKIAEDITYPRIKTAITGKRQDGSKYSDGIPANLRYYKIKYLEKKQSLDAYRQLLVDKMEEILQIKENAFEQIEIADNFALYQNSEKYLGLVYDPFALDEIIEKLEEVNKEKKDVILYVFSYSRDAFGEDYDVDFSIDFKAMPEGLLKTYQSILEELREEEK